MRVRCITCNRPLRGGQGKRHCRSCLVFIHEFRQEQLERARQEADRRAHQALLLAEFGTSRLKVFEYDGQELLPGGRFALTGRKPIRRLCADCGQDDLAIRGNWGPVFEDDNRRLTLLCWPCYRRRLAETESE